MFRPALIQRLHLTLLTSLFVIAGMPADADACAAPGCTRARVAPPSGATIPSDVPLPYVAPTGQGAGTTFRLLSPASVEVATTATPDPWWKGGGELLRADNPVAAGAGYRVVYKETCTTVGHDEEGSVTFDVGAAATRPTVAGTLRADSFEVGDKQVETSSGSCYSTINALSFDVLLTPPSAAYAAVTGYTVNVDGQTYRQIYYGKAKANGSELVVAGLHAACGKREQYDDNGLTLGLHTIEVTSHVAGATTDPPPVKVRVDVSCTDPKMIAVDDETPEDRTTNEADGGVTTSKPTQASAAASDPDATAQSGCACDVAGGARSSNGLAPLAAALGGVLAISSRRRQRDRGTRPSP